MMTYYDFFLTRILPLFFDPSLFGGIGERIFFYVFTTGCTLIITLPFVYLPVSCFVSIIRYVLKIKR